MIYYRQRSELLKRLPRLSPGVFRVGKQRIGSDIRISPRPRQQPLAPSRSLPFEAELALLQPIEQAKQHLESRPFDFAVLDIMGVNGYELLGIARGKKVTAVMLTAHALSPQDTMKSFQGGAASYVPKDKIMDLPSILADIVEARKKGKNVWGKWLDRMEVYYQEKFGPDWRKEDKDFWDRFTMYT